MFLGLLQLSRSAGWVLAVGEIAAVIRSLLWGACLVVVENGSRLVSCLIIHVSVLTVAWLLIFFAFEIFLQFQRRERVPCAEHNGEKQVATAVTPGGRLGLVFR